MHECGDVKYVRNPIRFEGDKAEQTPPPDLNENGNQILTEIGYSTNEITEILKIK